MNAERIANLLEARPFKTFMVFVNGWDESVVTVDDPGLASLHDEGETLIVRQHRATGAERWTKQIDLRTVCMVMVREGKAGDPD